MNQHQGSALSQPHATLTARTPTAPTNYLHLLRGPQHRWWLHLLNVPVTLILATVFVFAVFIVGGLVALSQGYELTDDLFEDVSNPIIFTAMNLSLGSLVVAVLISTLIVHRITPGFVSSVMGRFRWRWACELAIVVTPLYVVLFVVQRSVSSLGSSSSISLVSLSRNDIVLLCAALLTTPLQAAGEEYLFRGWIMQQVGGLLRHNRIAFLVAAALSAGFFSVAHTSFDPWVLAVLATTALCFCALTIYTGGLEAAVVLHAANNVVLMIIATATGTFGEGFVDQSTTLSAPIALLDMATTVVISLLAARFAAYRQICRTYSPPQNPSPPPVTGSAHSVAGDTTAPTAPGPT